MFFSLFRFEVNYQAKQKAFIGFSLIFLLFGLFLGSQGFASANVNFNSAYQISFNMALLSLGCVFAIMFFAISGMIRDRHYGSESIIYSTAVKKSSFFLSRFSGVLLFSVVVFSMAMVGFALGTFMPNLDAERLGPFRITYYLWTWLVFLLPNVFICTTIIFVVCSLTKNAMATYISAIFIYALYWVCSLFLNSPLLANSVPASPEGLALAALCDPFGISAFFEQTRFWTPLQKNMELISFSGNFMWNRLIWISVSAILLVMTYKLFSFQLTKKKNKKELFQEEKPETKVTYVPIKTSNVNVKKQGLPFLSLLKLELVSVIKSLPFIGVVLVWIVIAVTEIYSRLNSGGAYHDSLYPTTNFLIGRIREPMRFLNLLLIVFYSGEIVWRERNLNFNGIIDATPARNTVFFLSKAITIFLLPLILISIGIGIALGFQISKGYYEFDFGRYCSEFYYSGFGPFFYILMALFIQGLARNKYLGMTITGLVIIVFGGSMAIYLGIEHPLLRIGNMPDVTYTEMTGYTDTARPFHYLALYWGSLGALLTLVSFRLWQRGNPQTIRFRLKRFRSERKKWQGIAFAFSGILFIASGAFIYYNTNILNDYMSIKDNLDFREAYETKYKKFENLPELVLADVQTRMDIYPGKKKYVLEADEVLENISDSPINQVLISEQEPLSSLKLENADLVEYDIYLKTYLYKLKTPLLPGGQLKFSYRLVKEKKGFETDNGLANNGSYIVNYDFRPSFGYRKNVEIKNNYERGKRGLPNRTEEIINEDDLQSNQNENYKRIGFETILSTSIKQTALAPGNLVRHWQENGRNYYHYKTSSKIMPSIAYFSADYKIQKEIYKGVSIEQYYDSKHFYNIPDIRKSCEATLDYCIKNFGPYPFKELRIAEIPSYWGFGGYAHPGTISMVSDRLYLIDNRNPKNFDLVAKRTIHEVSHQYWGHTLAPKNIDGASIFVEGFAKYTEAVVMEKMYGKRALFQLGETANADYFSGRSYAAEPEIPLYLTKGQSYLSYGKGYKVMLALKELLGEGKVNLVLKNLLNKHKKDSIPTAVSTEMIDGFYNVAPKEYHPLINDWFKRIITYDLKVETTSVQKLKNGRFEITADISAKRFETLKNGEIVEIPIDEPIEVGVFSMHPRQLNSDDGILFLKPMRIAKAHQRLKITVNKIPKYLAIDPFGARLDADRVDNIHKL